MEFCGKHIHVHKSFQLILTTQSFPVLSQALFCSLNVFSLSPSLQFIQEYLLRESSSDLTLFDTSEFDSQTKESSQKLMKYLDKVNNGVVDSFIVDQIDGLMENFTKVCRLKNYLLSHSNFIYTVAR